MRALQVTLFVAGTVAFLAALGVAGDLLGEILWKVGVAFMLIDLVIMKLWPVERTPGAT